MSENLEEELEEVEKDIKKGKNISPKFSSAKDAIKYLKTLFLNPSPQPSPRLGRGTTTRYE